MRFRRRRWGIFSDTTLVEQPRVQHETNTLEHLSPRREGVIFAVPPAPHLAAMGLRPGKKVMVHARESFGGPLIVEIEGRSVALGRGLARKILLHKEAAN